MIAYYEWHMHTATHDAGGFFIASVHTNEKARKGRIWGSYFAKQKQRWRSLVHLLHSVVSSLMLQHGCWETGIGDPNVGARKHAPRHPIVHRHNDLTRGTCCDKSNQTVQTHRYIKHIMMQNHQIILWYMLRMRCMMILWILHAHTHTHLQWVKRTRVDVWSSTKWCGVCWWWQDSTWDRSAKIID